VVPLAQRLIVYLSGVKGRSSHAEQDRCRRPTRTKGYLL
jgi:hypothetical protein